MTDTPVDRLNYHQASAQQLATDVALLLLQHRRYEAALKQIALLEVNEDPWEAVKALRDTIALAQAASAP
jgi:hypothetical protein